MIRMGAWGLPGLALAFGLNILFVTFFNWNVYATYILVLAIVTSLNYFIIDEIVFRGDKSRNRQQRIAGYTLIVVFSRLSEWVVYTLLIWLLGIFFLLAQLLVSLLFLVVKYFSFKKLMT